MLVLKADEMANIDRETIENIGIPGVVLMENAARGVVEVIERKIEGRRALIFAGKGNNGGDALAVARNLINKGYEAKVVILAESEENLKGDCAVNFKILKNIGADISFISKETDLISLSSFIKTCDFVVDGIFGTGLTKPVEGFYGSIIDFINTNAPFVLSIDIPSGLFGSSSILPEGKFVKADITVTFAFPKIVHVLTPACKYVGEVFVVDISIPEAAAKKFDINRFLITKKMVSKVFPEREIDSHKYNYGYLAVVGGSCGKTGASSMTALAAMRTGVGLVSLLVPRDLNLVYEVKLTEPMTIPIESAEKGHFNANSIDEVLTVLNEGKFTAVALGPGLGWNKDTEIFVREILLNIDKPFVIDADGINCISKNVEILKKVKQPPILTPHTGEFSRLTGLPVSEILKNPVDLALNFAKEYRCVLVLKGARTIVVTPEGSVYINILGNSGMATAGTGDVLTGIIGTFAARGFSNIFASKAGVFLHSLSGDMAKEDLGEESLMATDLINYLPAAIKVLKEENTELSGFANSLREIIGV